MTELQKAIASLLDLIASSHPDTSRLMVPLVWEANCDPVDWLEAQPLFPKFYWRSRDEREEVLAIGQIRTFTSARSAETALGEGQRIWGGSSFDGRTERANRCLQSFFFLPRVEISRQDGRWTLAVNLCEDRQRIISALQALVENVKCKGEIQCNVLKKDYSPCYPEWENMVETALDAISDAQFEKVVLARRTTVTLDQPIPPAQLLKTSKQRNARAFHFMFALDSKHCFVGSTPERLFARQEGELATEALAGTIGRGKSEQEDDTLADWLMNDAKNIYENKLVVDDILSRLNPWCQDLYADDTPHLVKLRHVQHLRRSIRATLDHGISNSALLENLQPTAAIAGLPRDKAIDFIHHHEPFARGWYSGAVGYISDERSEFCVAIRSALILENELHLFAGAGIVPGSQPQSEWKELDRKTATLLNLIPQNDELVAEQVAS